MADEPITTMKNPPHPGHFVRAIIAELSLSVTAAAEVLGVTRAAVSAVLNQRAALSPDMALRIEKAFGVKMDTLMRIQNAYDIAQARGREAKIKVKPLVRPKETPQARLQKRHDGDGPHRDPCIAAVLFPIADLPGPRP